MRRFLLPALGCLSALGGHCAVDGLGPPPAAAATDAPRALLVAQADNPKPLAQVLKTIGDRFPGRALDAKLVNQDQHYQVKWLGDDGKVREVTSDAKSGKILDVR